jgi:hypothetical protein
MAHSDGPTADLPTVVLREPDGDLEQLLREAQFLLLKYPTAAQAAFRALVTEGRRFAETPAGQRWRRRLANSELVRQGRVFWEGSALNMLEDTGDTLLPSSLLDALLSALRSEDLATLLTRISLTDIDDADADPS